MVRSLLPTLSILGAFALGACSVSSAHEFSWSDRPEVHREVAAINELSRAFSAAYMRGDAAAMAALYTPDAVIFPTNSEMITSREQIERYWSLAPGHRITHHRATPTEIRVEGDLAYDYGVYEVSGERQGQPWGPVLGKYVILWKRQSSGEWRMHLDIWNSRPQRQP